MKLVATVLLVGTKAMRREEEDVPELPNETRYSDNWICTSDGCSVASKFTFLDKTTQSTCPECGSSKPDEKPFAAYPSTGSSGWMTRDQLEKMMAKQDSLAGQ